MPADNTNDVSAELDWDEAVRLKRQLTGELKKLTDDINEIDGTRSQILAQEIRTQRNLLDQVTALFRETKTLIDARNSELLNLSEKMSQSKNFLSIMRVRLPSENEDDLNSQVQANQELINQKQFNDEREKDAAIFKIKEATMKVEAIKAIRMVREQLSAIQKESAAVNEALIKLDEKLASLQSQATVINNRLNELYDSKRVLLSERERKVFGYDEKLREFESVNERLDEMSTMRRKQRREYGRDFPNDALFKLKENARKKLESGSKLTFDELKLLYDDKD